MFERRAGSISKPPEDLAWLDRPISRSPPLEQQLREHARVWLARNPLLPPAILERLAPGLAYSQERKRLERGGATI
jgi:hypothetical protein